MTLLRTLCNVSSRSRRLLLVGQAKVPPIYKKLTSLYSTQNLPSQIDIDGKIYKADEWTNVPPYILELTKRQLHKVPNHPIGILQDLIQRSFSETEYTFYNEFKPTVTTHENFDSLGFPKDHPSRSKSDTYYINKDYLLRTHTSAHEHECFQSCKTPGYFITADVYRRDEVDRTHYPAFHQMEGARLWSLDTPDLEQQLLKDIDAIPQADVIVEDPLRHNPSHPNNPKQDYMSDRHVELISIHLKRTLEYLVSQVFEAAKKSAIAVNSSESYIYEPLRVRWVEAYFPWTTPSWEIEVWWKGEWLECCGCGLVQQQVLLNANLGEEKLGWAFGVGLDRIAMLLFGIPDIRLFWSADERFHRQFKAGTISTFAPYSKYPGIKRDVSFWLPESSELHVNDVMELVRKHGSDLVESVSHIDDFTHPKTGKRSQCYSIHYQSMDRNLTNDEINNIHKNVEIDLIENFNVEIR